MTAEAFPLTWPAGRPRVVRGRRERSRFDTSLGMARDGLLHELRMLDARNIVLSSNLQLRNDGLPRAGQPEPDDAGIAVYFTYRGREMSFACDRWDRVRDNMRAIEKTIEALRGVARWGSGDMLEAAFTGFAALPAPMAVNAPWWEVLGVMEKSGPDGINGMYRVLRSRFHPDKPGGDAAKFDAVQKAYDQAVAEGRA